MDAALIDFFHDLFAARRPLQVDVVLKASQLEPNQLGYDNMTFPPLLLIKPLISLVI